VSAVSLVSNGSFESGFAGWTRVNQLGSDGTFALQTGTVSPVNGFAVPAPPLGTTAAMTDSQGPGTHVLYQDFVVPAAPGNYLLSFALFLNSQNAFFVPSPANLDFSTPALNQQFRADILASGADPFSVAAADVLQNLYQTLPANPTTSGYTTINRDVSAVLNAHLGQTLRLRFAEVDNIAPFNAGIDAVSLDTAAAVPEPSTLFSAVAGMLVLIGIKRRR